MYQKMLCLIRELYPSNDLSPLHVLMFSGNESENVQEVIDSNFVSSVDGFNGRAASIQDSTITQFGFEYASTECFKFQCVLALMSKNSWQGSLINLPSSDRGPQNAEYA